MRHLNESNHMGFMASLCLVIDNEWGGLQDARLSILSDFFKHGFDGSGDDGGQTVSLYHFSQVPADWKFCTINFSKYAYVCDDGSQLSCKRLF